jgi:hypothetical protein
MGRPIVALVSLLALLSIDACKATNKGDGQARDASPPNDANADASSLPDGSMDAQASDDAGASHDGGDGGSSNEHDAGAVGGAGGSTDAGDPSDAGPTDAGPTDAGDPSDAEDPSDAGDASLSGDPCPLAAGVVEVLVTTDRLARSAAGGDKYLFYYEHGVGLQRMTVCGHAVDLCPKSLDVDGGSYDWDPIATYGDTVFWTDFYGVRRATLDCAPLPMLYRFQNGPGSQLDIEPHGDGLLVTEGLPAPHSTRAHVSLDLNGNVRGRQSDAFSGGPTLFDQGYVYECGPGPFSSACLNRYDKDLSNQQQIPIEGEKPRSMLLQDGVAFFAIGNELRTMPVAGGAVTPIATLGGAVTLGVIDETNIYVSSLGQGMVAVAINEPHTVVPVAPMAEEERISAATQDSWNLYFTVQKDGLYEIRRASKPQ